MQIFLSHSSVDKDLARRLGADLQAAGIGVWLDQWQIAVGDRFEQLIEQGLEQSDFVVVLLSTRSVANAWVDREWRNRFEDEIRTSNVKLIPVRCEPCQIPDFLAQRSYADISGGAYQLGVQHLLNLLRHYSGQSENQQFDHSVYQKLRLHYLELERQIYNEETCSDTLGLMLPIVKPIGIEVGSDLIPMIEPDARGFSPCLSTVIPAIRQRLLSEFGFNFPGVAVRGNESMPPRAVIILIDELLELVFEMSPFDLLVEVDANRLKDLGISAETREYLPHGGHFSAIAPGEREQVEAAGWRVFSAPDFLGHVVYSVVSRMAAEFVDIDVVQRLLYSATELLLPDWLSLIDLTMMLKRLADERVNIRDIRTIVHASSAAGPGQRDIPTLAELARQALSGAISAALLDGRAELPALRLAPAIEQRLEAEMQATASEQGYTIDTQFVDQLAAAVQEAMNSAERRGSQPALLVTLPAIRALTRQIIKITAPDLPVVSRRDITPDVTIDEVCVIDLAEARAPLPAAGAEP